jgi:hypothetical protein
VVGHVVPPKREPRSDELVLGELVVDRDAQIENGVPVALDHLGQTVGAADAVRMKHVVVGDQVGKRVEVPGGRLRVAIADHGLVVLLGALGVLLCVHGEQHPTDGSLQHR